MARPPMRRLGERLGRLRVQAARRLAGPALASLGQERWSAVDDYLAGHLVGDDSVSAAALAAGAAAELPPITVSATQGKLLELLVRVHGARRILELGTLGGYSSIWLARALPPDGRLVTLEASPRFAEVARGNILRAGLGETVEVRVGPALETLPQLVAEAAPFDMIFIDADKANYPHYLEWSLKLSRPGTLIVADNVIGGGAIVEAGGSEPWGEDGGVQGVRRFYDLLAAEPRLSATAIQTVGDKGYDGFVLALVTAPSAE
jgi:predicted O-methyltransferase YrrM